MTQLDPANTTLGDLCNAALKESGAVGVGQQALAEDSQDAWARCQWMLQQWERKRWLVYQLKTYNKTSTGAVTYSVGPGGDFDTGAGSVRPAKLESAFLRQLTQSQPNQIDYQLEILQSMEDYNKIALKQLMSFPGFAFLDPGWPLGTLYTWPVPQAAIYGVFITVLQQLPAKFATLNAVISLPYEYYAAILYNLTVRLYPKYKMRPDPVVVALAKDSLATLRGANSAIARLQLPQDLKRSGQYNIFADRFY